MHDGPCIAALAVSLLMQQHLPWARPGEVVAELWRVTLREGTLASLLQRTAETRVPVESQISHALVKADVRHHDERGRSVLGTRWWVHVAWTLVVPYDAAHLTRGQEALTAMGIAPGFAGTSVHDGWQSSVACG